ncbi:MAG: hypothetical protein ABEI99_03300 [Halobaculum sp.]
MARDDSVRAVAVVGRRRRRTHVDDDRYSGEKLDDAATPTSNRTNLHPHGDHIWPQSDQI